MTGIGPVAVRQPRVRDREASEGERIRFNPTILPPYARRTKSLEVLIPILYLKGISTGDFEEVLAALVGKDAPGLSASTIARLKEVWTEEHERWQKRDLSTKRYVYFWVDGIHLEARLEDQAQCILVIIGATPEGKKELVGFTDGMRESAQSWRDLLLDLKRRGVAAAPETCRRRWRAWLLEGAWRGVADNTRAALLGAQDGERPEQAAEEPAFEGQARAAGHLDGRDKEECRHGLGCLRESYGIKYDKAVDCLTKDRDTLLAFYDFPAEHWKHLRTTDVLDKRSDLLGQQFSQFFVPFFCSAPCARHSFIPAHTVVRPPRAAAVKDGSPPGGRPKGLSLTAVSTVASSSVSGLAPPSLVPNSKHAPRLDARFRPYGTNWRGTLPFWGADDRVAKSGEEDGIPAALPSLYCRSSFAASAHPGRFEHRLLCFRTARSTPRQIERRLPPPARRTARSTSRRDLIL